MQEIRLDINTCGKHVTIKLLPRLEAQHIEGILGVLELFIVINGFDLRLSLGDVGVIVDVV